jgi:inosine/xanthosine triphosphate pyrophosphatase family protein
MDALGGAHVLYSVRFHATIAITIPEPFWSQAACRLNIQEPAPGLHMFEGDCPGGFGYDPIFLLPELSMDEKNRLSHRARAVLNAEEFLKSYSQQVVDI